MYLKGENIQMGIGGSSAAARTVAVAPSIWVPGISPSGIKVVVDKVLIKETRGVGVMSTGSEIVGKRAEGDLEFNIRSISIGWILRSLFGASTSVAKIAPNTSVYDHTFTVDAGNPQHPALTLALSQPNIQDYEYPLAIVNKLEIKTPIKELVRAKASFIATGENEHAAYTPSNNSADSYFRHTDIVIKIASTVAGLAGATALKLKEFNLSINNNSKPNQNIGEMNASDVLSYIMEIGGSMTIDYQAKTYHDIFVAGTYQAMSITLTRSDVTIGTSANPTIVITMPRVSFENLDPDRSADDKVSEGIDFTAHYDATTSKAIDVVLTNTTTTYTVA